MTDNRTMKMIYRNYRGEVSERTVSPKRIWYGVTDWHPEPGWLMEAFDREKGEYRDFAIADCDFRMVAAQPAQGEAVAWRVYNMLRQGVPTYVKARGRDEEPSEYLFPAHRGMDAAECARLMRGEVQPLYAHPPTPPDSAGAELDALVEELWASDAASTLTNRAARAITALRANGVR